MPPSSGFKELYPGRNCSVYLDRVLPILKVEAASYCETLVSVHEPTLCQNPANSHQNITHYESLKICIRPRLFKYHCIGMFCLFE